MMEPVALLRDAEGEHSIGSLASVSPAKYQHDHKMEIDDSDDSDFASLVLASSMVAAIDATSSRVPLGLSSTSLQLAKGPAASFTPPARPSSTPFPHFEMRSSSSFGCSASDDNECHRSPTNLPHRTMTQSLPATQFGHLPTEVHETILDHIFGYCVSITSRSAMKISSLTRGWSSALRHSRRKELTALALVNRTWRGLVQQRLFRHIKLKATTDSIEGAFIFLASSPHLASYVKHIEVWFPVFQPTYGPLATSNTLALPTVTLDGLTNATYTLPANNCALEDVFHFVAMALPRSQVLTLEGGERRKAPKVMHVCQKVNSSTTADDAFQLHSLYSVRTLVTKGQWNLMRNESDFLTIMNALPNLEEWQGSYSKAKSKSYISAAGFLPLLPSHVTNLYLCMENDYRREGVMPAFYYKVLRKTHICASLAQVLPTLEHFAYTGRMCHHVFDEALRQADPLTSRLKSVDITVKNCCRQSYSFHESGSGIQDMAFIRSFEKLVLSAIQSMEKFKKLEYLRIRFVDLDSVLPPLNPYFLMKNGSCYGIWNELLIAEIERVRPGTKYSELSESFGSIIDSKDGRIIFTPEYQRTRLASLKLSNYRSLATTITI